MGVMKAIYTEIHSGHKTLGKRETDVWKPKNKTASDNGEEEWEEVVLFTGE